MDSTPLPEEFTVITEERYVLKCGYFPCVQLDWDFTFKRCVGCRYAVTVVLSATS